MTAATQSAAGSSSPPGPGRTHPCNPATLSDPCPGCDRPMHRAKPRRVCTNGHPPHEAHGRCKACAHRHRRHTTARPAPPPPPPSPPPPAGWQRHAACRDADPALFFPAAPRLTGPVRAAAETTARRWCHGCPVRPACDAYANHTRSIGLWAGVWRRWRGSHYARTPVLPDTDAGLAARRPLGRPQRPGLHNAITSLDGHGWAAAAIAAELGCSTRTVERHRAQEATA